MKKVAILLSLVVLFAVSCAKSDLESQQVSNVSSTPCKQELLKSSGISDKIDIEFTNKGVQITYNNFVVPCDFTTVNVTHTFVNGVLSITQQGFPNHANCICYSDVSYTIEGISQNEVNVIFINNEQIYCYNDNVQSNYFVLEVKNVINGTDVANVKAIISSLKKGSDGKTFWDTYEVASANFEDSVFKLNFPANLSEEYLGSQYELFNIFSFEGITVSDRQAKTGDIWLYAYNSVGQFVGNLRLTSNGWYTEIMYSDRDFTVRGHFQSGSEENCSFIKGLNVVYIVWGGNTKATTQKPLNEEFNWVLEPPPSPL